MPDVLLTAADRAAAAKSLQARQAVRQLRQATDTVVRDLTVSLVRLAGERTAAIAAVGANSTRPHYTDDLRHLRVQLERYDALVAALEKGR